MKERPILFSAPMVRAILDGRKTQTRRTVVPMPGKQREWLTQQGISKVPHGHMASGGWQMHHPMAGTIQNGVAIEETSPLGWIRCPYGAPGDRLWVKEAHQIFSTWGSAVVIYREDGSQSEHKDQHAMGPGIHINMGNPLSEYTSFNERFPERWRPSIHMPRAASRLTLEVTEVRVERVQDISEHDATQEGVEWSSGSSILDWRNYLTDAQVCTTAKHSFETLWHSINGAASWNANPWVWVVSFRRVDP